VVSLEPPLSPRGDSQCAKLLRTGELKGKIADTFQERFGLENAREWIEEGFEEDRSKSWRDVLEETVEELYKGTHENDLRDVVGKYVWESPAGDEEVL
jgi:hypothetical protein